MRQRLLSPVAPRNAHSGAPGTAWPEACSVSLDPLTALAWVAARTERVRLGVSVLIMPFYAPVVLARALAALALLARGRLDVGQRPELPARAAADPRARPRPAGGAGAAPTTPCNRVMDPIA
jgi:alkanesulfonate monooxygenase SsuD/methylene tetrahydromethanopterin reductase-like flavin-dependent oxidoreductase (luciferase family)